MKTLTIHRSGKVILALLSVLLLVFVSKTRGWISRGEREAGITVRQCSDQPPRDDILRVALFPDASCLPGIIENRGLIHSPESLFFKNHGLRVSFEIVESFDLCKKKLLDGKFDIVWSTVDGLALSYRELRHINPVVFYQVAASTGAHGIAAAADIAAPFDIERKTVTCVRHSPSHFLMLQVIDQAGLNPKNIKWLYAPTDRIAAYYFKNRRASVYAGPLAGIEAGGMDGGRNKLILSTRDAPGLITRVFVSREAMLLAREEKMAGFIRGWQEGLAIMKKDLPGAAETVRRFLHIADTEVLNEIGRYAYGDNTANLNFFDLTHDSSPDFTVLFSLASRRWGGDIEKLNHGYSSMVKNSAVVLMLQGKSTYQRYNASRKPYFQPLPPGSENRLMQITRPFILEYIPGQGRFSYESLSRSSEIEGLAALYPGAYLLLGPLGENSQTGGAVILQDAARVLNREYAISPDRLFFTQRIRLTGSGEKIAGVAVALALFEKKQP